MQDKDDMGKSSGQDEFVQVGRRLTAMTRAGLLLKPLPPPPPTAAGVASSDDWAAAERSSSTAKSEGALATNARNSLRRPLSMGTRPSAMRSAVRPGSKGRV